MSNVQIDFLSVFNNAPDPCLVLTPGLEVLAASDSYLRFAMTPRDRLVGRRASDVLSDEELEASFLRAVQSRRPDAVVVGRYGLRNTTAQPGTSEQHAWSVLNTPVLSSAGADGRPVIEYVIHRVVDLGTCSSAEDSERRFLPDRIKSCLLAELSHDLREPLTPVLTSLHALLQLPELDDRIRSRLSMAERNSQLMLRRIEGITDLARLESTPPTPRDTNVDSCADEPTSDESPTPANLDKPVVLVVDDDPDIRREVGSLLGPAYRVVFAAGGLEGLEKAARVMPDLVVTDMMMPGMNGEALLQALRGLPSLAQIPVLFLTARADDELRIRMVRKGVHAFMLKPFNPDELRARVDSLVERARAQVIAQRDRTQETVARLAGEVSHQINNRLQAIYGMGALLMSSLDKSDPRREEVSGVLHAAEQAAGLTRQLLDLGGWQVLRPEPFSLDEMVAAIGAKVRDEFGPSFEVVVRQAARKCIVEADSGQLERAVWALLHNSQDSMPSGGRITLETALLELDTARPIRDYPDIMPAGRYVMLAVNDTGSGMDRTTLRRAFDPFFTTRARNAGRGLGLSIAYGIVRQSKGFLSACSEPGVGTAFKIYLPAKELSAHEPAPEAVSDAGPTGRRVLLVEDDQTVRRMAERILEVFGYHAVSASCGSEALELLARSPDVDILVTDVILPGMDGGKLAAQVRRLRPGMPVLYVSGYTGDDLVERGLLQHGEAFLPKPFTPEALNRALVALLGGARWPVA